MLNWAGNKDEVIAWMREHVWEYEDECGEISCTDLAEEAFNHFDSADDVHPDFFEWAYDVAQEYEQYTDATWAEAKRELHAVHLDGQNAYNRKPFSLLR
jgi:hypothetical protein